MAKLLLCYFTTICCTIIWSQEDTTKISPSQKSENLLNYYKNQNYVIDSCRIHKTVPNLQLKQFPKDLKASKYQIKKEIFFATLIPLILSCNDSILQERTDMMCLKNDSTWSASDSSLFRELCRKYYSKTFVELQEKIDIIPPSIIIAQGLEESGWGTSFFAMNANSIFGIKAPRWTKMPTIKHPKYSFVTYKYETLKEGLYEYLLNLNRHRSYKPLREERAKARILPDYCINYKTMLKGLKRYSSRGIYYVKHIQIIIEKYKLNDFDEMLLIGPTRQIP